MQPKVNVNVHRYQYMLSLGYEIEEWQSMQTKNIDPMRWKNRNRMVLRSTCPSIVQFFFCSAIGLVCLSFKKKNGDPLPNIRQRSFKKN